MSPAPPIILEWTFPEVQPGYEEVIMPVRKLKKCLDDGGVKYISIQHSPAYTAQEIAASAHVPGSELAKTVVVKFDGRLAMAVLSASEHIDLARLKYEVGAKSAVLASEEEFRDAFPDCEVGAMPPFGNLYGMDVYVSEELASHGSITFSAGSHTELIRLAYADFERLAKPIELRFAAVR